MRFWKWQRAVFALDQAEKVKVDYVGDPNNIAQLKALLGRHKAKNVEETLHSSAALMLKIRPYPMRDCIVLPFALTTIVKLNRSLEDIMATYARSLRRSINQDVPLYRREHVSDPQKIAELECNMLRPYVAARHDSSASQLDSKVILKLASPEYGRMDVLYQGEQAVGCHIGSFYEKNGQKYWQVNRLGYPESVFSDYKRWGEVNSINLHLALDKAIQDGYDYCDYGVSLAKPGSGLIEWKRRRKGFLSTHECHKFFYLKFPNTGASQFFWDSPVFAVERKGITLHLGLPIDKTDDEIAERYHEMGYGGLFKVYLHCTQAPSQALIDRIKALYADQETQPEVITYFVK